MESIIREKTGHPLRVLMRVGFCLGNSGTKYVIGVEEYADNAKDKIYRTFYFENFKTRL